MQESLPYPYPRRSSSISITRTNAGKSNPAPSMERDTSVLNIPGAHRRLHELSRQLALWLDSVKKFNFRGAIERAPPRRRPRCARLSHAKFARQLTPTIHDRGEASH